MFYKRCDCAKGTTKPERDRRWARCAHPWWHQFEYRGRRFRVPTGQGDRGVAEVEARRKRVEKEQETGPRGGSGITLLILEGLHTKHLKTKGRSEQRIDTVENLWRNLYRHLGGEHRDGMTLTLNEVEAYEGARRADGARGQTIRRERQALRRGFRIAKRKGLIGHMPFDWDDLEPIESDAPKIEQAGKPRTEDEILKVMRKLSKKARTAGYHRMLWLIRRTGLRLEEFRRCTAAWVRPAPRGSAAHAMLAIPAEGSKTGEPRVVPLTKEDAATIRELGGRFATKKFNHALWLASAEAKVTPALTPRDLRATYLTEIDDPRAAQKLGGHSNIATTGLYIDLDARRALEAGARAVATVGGHRRKRQSEKRSKINGRP
jgi:site-specific recombinase XerD